MKTTLIVGASSGIGYALAQNLINNNQSVISLSRNKPDLENIEHYSYDVLGNEQLPQISQQIDGIVYCPGSINLKPFRTLKQQDFIAELELNVLSAIKILQAYSSNLIQSKNWLTRFFDGFNRYYDSIALKYRKLLDLIINRRVITIGVLARFAVRQ